MKDKRWQRLPYYILYAPFAPILAYMWLNRHKINTCMDNGGFYNSSKYKYLKLLPQAWYPQTQLNGFNQLIFPLIVKPDNGMRGKGVQMMTEPINLSNKVDWLFQEYSALPNECGVFYVNGEITSLISKVFKEGQPIGSHNLGTTFIDERKRITPELTKAIERIAAYLPEFTYGRMDIKFNTWEELENLENFKIIEINGLNSELTHIYHPGYSLLKAYKEIFINYRKLLTL